MLLILLVITIVLSIVFEFASQIIYILKIRKILLQERKKLSFDWLPQKRKAHVAEYKKIVNGSKDDLIWGDIVIWLSYLSWMFLVVAALVAIFVA